MAAKKLKPTATTLSPGFYACNIWPFWFEVILAQDGKLNIWGFSIWKNQPGYRTLGVSIADWILQHPGIKVTPDHDRTLNKQFISDYRISIGDMVTAWLDREALSVIQKCNGRK